MTCVPAEFTELEVTPDVLLLKVTNAPGENPVPVIVIGVLLAPAFT